MTILYNSISLHAILKINNNYYVIILQAFQNNNYACMVYA